MEERDGSVIVTEAHWQRLWEKSAIGQRIQGGGLRLQPEEVIYSHVHRHQTLPYDKWISDQILKDDTLLNRYIILESLRVPGNLIVILNHDGINWDYSDNSWALRWHKEKHPDKDEPTSEIRWHPALESIDTIELYSWCKSVTQRERIPEILVIDDEGSVVTYEISIANPTGNIDMSDLDNIGVNTNFTKRYSDVEKDLISGHINNELTTVLDDLHHRGLYIRSGFKYGTRWRAYEDEITSSHAPWLIDSLQDSPENWTAACLNARLAAGVNKRYIVAVLSEKGDIKYLEYRRPPSDRRWTNLEKY